MATASRDGLETFVLSTFDVKQIRQGLKLLAKELEKCAKQEEEKCGLSSAATQAELDNIRGHDEVVGLLQRVGPQIDAFEDGDDDQLEFGD